MRKDEAYLRSREKRIEERRPEGLLDKGSQDLNYRMSKRKLKDTREKARERLQQQYVPNQTVQLKLSEKREG